MAKATKTADLKESFRLSNRTPNVGTYLYEGVYHEISPRTAVLLSQRPQALSAGLKLNFVQQKVTQAPSEDKE